MKATSTEVITLGINGMTCGSCQRRVQDALLHVPGVEEARVDLVGATASVRYDPWQTSPGDLERAVRAAGYEIEAVGPGAERPARPGAGRPARRGCCS